MQFQFIGTQNTIEDPESGIDTLYEVYAALYTFTSGFLCSKMFYFSATRFVCGFLSRTCLVLVCQPENFVERVVAANRIAFHVAEMIIRRCRRRFSQKGPRVKAEYTIS